MTGPGAIAGPVLVTGATGFLGSHFAEACARSGAAVRGLVRDVGLPLPDGVEPAACSDLMDRDAVRRAVQGIATVVHFAGRAHVTRDRGTDALAEFRRSNVAGTQVVFEEAQRAGVACFLLVSSAGAVRQQSETVLTEATPPAPTTAYGRSKLEAEEALRALAADTAVSTLIVRPPMVYGPRMRGNPATLFRLVDRGIPLPVGRVRNRRSALYVGNLVAAMLAMLAARRAGCEVFFVGDAGEFSTPELVRRIARVLERPVRLVPVPVSLLRAAGRLGDLAARLAPVPLTSRTVEALTESLVVSAARLRERTGFVPPYSPDEGLRVTAEWYRSAARRR